MTFAEMETLLDEVLEFFLSTEEYKDVKDTLEQYLIPSIVSRQYVERRDSNNKLTCFITYWLTDDAGYEALKRREEPQEKHRGNIVYGVDCASKLTTRETFAALNELRTRHKYKILCLHTGDKFKQYRGCSHGD